MSEPTQLLVMELESVSYSVGIPGIKCTTSFEMDRAEKKYAMFEFRCDFCFWNNIEVDVLPPLNARFGVDDLRIAIITVL